MRIRIGLGVVLAALVGCAEQPTKETIGTGAGAVIGGVIGQEVGDSTTAAVIGGVVGAIAGREIGRRMDESDRRQAYTALEENRPVTWQSDDGEQYAVQPTDTFTRDDRVCRQYETSLVVEGKTETSTGTACRREDGTWEVVS